MEGLDVAAAQAVGSRRKSSRTCSWRKQMRRLAEEDKVEIGNGGRKERMRMEEELQTFRRA